MSGRIHDKGFVILTGYIQGKYGQTRPLSLQASIGFEQSYGEIDGDSASSTELYALLSQLSGKPLAQGIAVTGSVNQNGEVQAGQFTIYVVATIDEGIEVLTGVPAGELQEDGTYPEGTIHHLVEERLEEMAKRTRDFGKDKNAGDEVEDSEDEKGDSTK
jgi:hypothetical protein